jgi:tetratricopeptide (TPR) repeat protein
LAAIAILVVSLALLRQPLADRLWPQARVDALLAEGEAALAAGRLDQADGQGARQKFEAAQALDSDRGEGRAGLARVGLAALERARASIGAGRPAEARRWLDLAAELQVPRARIEPVEQALRKAEAAGVDLPALRGRAAAALAAGDAGLALPLYAQWLALEPGDAGALEGREDAVSLLLEGVPAALQADELAAASRLLGQARRHDPGHAQLPALQAAWSRALAAQSRRAEADLRGGRLEAAAERFTVLRAAAPEDAGVAEGAQRTARALAQRTRQLAGDFRFDEAARALDLARVLAPGDAEVEEAARELGHAREVARRHPPVAPAGRTQTAQVRQALGEFERALEHGDWIEPPGASAYDHLRAAQALAPGAAAVRAAAARMHEAVAGCVDTALRDNRLRTAQGCFDAWQALVPADPALRSARPRLAQRWLAVGEERLRAGELEVAARALDSARSLDPATPGLDDFAARLARARSAAPL